MTTIAAARIRGRLYMAGDSAVSDDDGLVVLQKRPKIFKRDPLIVGSCGTSSWEAFLDSLELRRIPRNGDLDRWIRTEFREQLAAYEPDEDEESEAIVGTTERRIYIVEASARSPWEVAEPYTAIGKGGPVALGALRMLLRHAARLKLSAQEIMREALETAEAHNTMTKRPFSYLSC